MNAAPFVGVSRTSDWERRAAISRPVKPFSPVCVCHRPGDGLRTRAVYRARAHFGQPRESGWRQDTIRRAPDGGPAAVQDVGVDHGRPPILMPQEFLICPDVVAVLQEVSGKGVPEGMGRRRFRETRLVIRVIRDVASEYSSRSYRV